MPYAVFDPNWGEPIPLLTTIRATPNEAVEAAVMTDERGARLYSGALVMCNPPKVGSWKNMVDFGYSVREVNVGFAASANREVA